VTSLGNESRLLAKHSIIYGLGNALNSLVAILLLPIYTRYLSPTDYGVKELVALSTDVVGILLSTAISSAVYRFYFEYEDQKNRNEVISTGIISIGTLLLVAVLFLSLSTRTMAKYILDSPDLYRFFQVSFISLWFQSIAGIGINYLRAMQKSILYVSISFGRLVVAILLNIYFVIFLGMGVMGILLSTLIASGILCISLTVPILAQVGVRFSREKLLNMVRFGLPLIPSQLGAFVVHLSDRFFIKGYCSIADAGLYSLGYRFGTIPSNFISSPFNQIWEPRRLELYKQEGSEKVFGRVFTYFLFLMLFTGLAVSVLTRDILMIISDEKFWPAYRIVPIIVLANIVFAMHYHFNIGIIISKKTKYLAYINFSNGIFILLLNVVLIKNYGVYGAAFATLIAFIYKVSLTYYFSMKIYKIYFEFARIAKMFLAATLIYIASCMIDSRILAIDVVLKSATILIFPFLLYLMKFFTDYEKKKATEYILPKLQLLKNIG
jgi:O-antigen/teichoic acid export membrane protein